MAYEYLTQFNSKNYTPAASVPSVFGFKREIKYITIHHWGGFGQNFNNVINWLCTNNVPTSAHFVAEAGRVAQIVNDGDAAWHAGVARGNAQSIGIECRPEATDADYQTVAELIADLRKTYGDVPLVPHSAWLATACPGRWDLVRLDRLARSINTTPPVTPPVVVPPTPRPVTPPVQRSEVQWVVEDGETLSQVAAYYNGPSVAQIAAANGIADPNVIQVGQVLNIPGPLEWVVTAGDTLSTIAAYYAVSVQYIADLNGIQNVNFIPAGQVLKIK